MTIAMPYYIVLISMANVVVWGIWSARHVLTFVSMYIRM